MIMATFRCAIEMEPKTLNPDQLNHAKELAAAGIIRKTEARETSDFIIQEASQGKTLEVIEHIIEENNVKGLDNIVTIPYQCTINIDNVATESAHHCLCNAIVVESPISDEARHHEPLTAPF